MLCSSDILVDNTEALRAVNGTSEAVHPSYVR